MAWVVIQYIQILTKFGEGIMLTHFFVSILFSTLFWYYSWKKKPLAIKHDKEKNKQRTLRV